MQYIKALMAFKTGIDIGGDIPQRVAHMQPSSRWIGKHIQYIIFGQFAIGGGLIGLVLSPIGLPTFFNVQESVLHLAAFFKAVKIRLLQQRKKVSSPSP